MHYGITHSQTPFYPRPPAKTCGAVFPLLMRRNPDRVPATEVAQALDFKPIGFSTYMNALMQADLVTQERLGTSLRYAVQLDDLRDTFDYLLTDCCLGRPEICAPLTDFALTDGTAKRTYNVLFICTGNTARSISAEQIRKAEGGARFAAYSAGTNPRSEPNPIAPWHFELNSKYLSYDFSCLHAKMEPLPATRFMAGVR